MNISKATKKQLIEEINRLREALSRHDGKPDRPDDTDQKSREPHLSDTLPPMDIEDGYFEVDLAGNMLSCNEPMARILGYPRSELIGMNYTQFMSKRTVRQVLLTFYHTYSTKNPTKASDWALIRKDKTRSYVETSISLVTNDSDTIVGFRGIARDITDKKTIEKKLKESEERYRILVENSPDSIVVVQNGKIVFCNERLYSRTGYTRDELFATEFKDFIHPDDLQMTIDYHIRRMKGEDVPDIYELKLLRKDGSAALTEIRITMMQWNDAPAVFCILRDNSERNLYERALIESEEKHRSVVENAVEGIAIVQDNIMKFVNKKVLDVLGCEMDDILYKSILAFVHPEDKDEVKQHYRERLQGEPVPEKYSIRAVTCSGEERWVEVSGVIIEWEGRPAILNFYNDITERKQAEDGLREWEEKYRSVVENAKEIISVYQDGIIRYINPYAVIQYGFSENELIGKSFINFIHPDDVDMVIERHKMVLQGTDTLDPVEYRVFNKQREIKWVTGTAISIEWEGNPAALVFLNDITERKNTEVRLRESEERLRSIFETSGDILFMAYSNGRIIDVNPAIEEIVGYTRKEALRMDAHAFYNNPDDRKAVMRTLQQGGFVKNREIEIKKKNGEIATCLITATTLMDSEKNIIGMQGTIKDITEKRNLEKQLIQTQKMEALGNLAGGIAHNFNNILVGIMGYAEFLISKKKPEDWDYKAARTIFEATQRAAELTQQLLNIARGSAHFHRSVDLNDVVKETLNLLYGSFDKSIGIAAHLQKSINSIMGDQGQLEQCLLNICINARDAMPQGGELVIETRNQYLDEDFARTHLNAGVGEYVILSVSDTGIGMSPKIKERIFEPFFTTKEKTGGTGMGMASLYGIVKNHGGFITVYSEEGKGSIFRLYFPVSVSDAEKRPDPELDAEEISKATILIIDDEQQVLDIWSDFFSDNGFDVLVARTAEAGIETYRTNAEDIDMIILDYVLPGMTGKKVLGKIKAIDTDVKVLIASGYSNSGRAKEIVDDDVDGFIQKPCTLSELMKKVQSILNS